jgi:hypothetical protein
MAEEFSFGDFFSDLGSAVGKAANPFSAVVDIVGQEISTNRANQKTLESNMIYTQEGSSTRSFQGGLSPIAGQSASPGFFAQGGALRTGLRDFGGFLGDFAPVAGVFGLGDRFQNMPPSGAQTINRQLPDESSSSGEITGANLGMGSNLIQAATRFARSPGGGSAIGFGAGALGAALSGGGDGKPRITRRMKSDVRKIYMMAGMNPNATAQILNNLGTYPRMNFDASLVFFILTKRFRNDGPVVTKAAVRKTKSTLRRMKGVVDMYNSVCKPTTRRAPARRAMPKAVQLIKN